MALARRYILVVDEEIPSGNTTVERTVEYNLTAPFSGVTSGGSEVVYSGITEIQLSELNDEDYDNRVNDFLYLLNIEEDGKYLFLRNTSTFNDESCDPITTTTTTTAAPTTTTTTTTTTAAPTTTTTTTTTTAAPVEDGFIMDVLTTSSNDTFGLPLTDSGNYNFIVEWGDGTSDTITSFNQAEVVHTYANAGLYTIRMVGTIFELSFNDNFVLSPYAEQLIEIKNWGTSFLWGNSQQAFRDCINLEIVSAPDTPNFGNLTSLNSVFRGCTSLTTITNLTNWDLSNLAIFDFIFFGCTLFNADVSGWDTSNITQMVNTFQNSGFNSDVSGWNVTNLGNAGRLFDDCSLSVDNYDALLIGWEAQNVKNNVALGVDGLSYTSNSPASDARARLINQHNWTIGTDSAI